MVLLGCKKTNVYVRRSYPWIGSRTFRGGTRWYFVYLRSSRDSCRTYSHISDAAKVAVSAGGLYCNLPQQRTEQQDCKLCRDGAPKSEPVRKEQALLGNASGFYVAYIQLVLGLLLRRIFWSTASGTVLASISQRSISMSKESPKSLCASGGHLSYG